MYVHVCVYAEVEIMFNDCWSLYPNSCDFEWLFTNMAYGNDLTKHFNSKQIFPFYCNYNNAMTETKWK